MTLAKDIASHLLKIHAVYINPEEPFTWASGIKSPIYTDNLSLFNMKVNTLQHLKRAKAFSYVLNIYHILFFYWGY